MGGPRKKKNKKKKRGRPPATIDPITTGSSNTVTKKPRKARKRPMVDTKTKASTQKKEVAHEVRKEDLQAALLAEADALPRSSPHAHARKRVRLVNSESLV